MVIAIVLFMLALLIPGLNDAREQARRVVCSNNLRQWGFALITYRNDHHDRVPMEGPAGGKFADSGTWYNELPQYLGLPAYREIERFGKLIKEFPELHVWICPSKSRNRLYKSDSGQNQFHYGMNQVLDGLGDGPLGSKDTPGFPDPDYDNKQGEIPTYPLATVFAKKPNTVFLFDIAPNSPGGTPRVVATRFQTGDLRGEYHGDYANLLFIDGSVGHCTTDDLVTNRDFKHGKVIWTNPRLYWGYPRP